MSNLLLVTGSRALADTSAAHDWARVQLRSAVAAMVPSGLPPACVLTGGCEGSPDFWVREPARARGFTVVEYRLDGGRYVNGERNGDWPHRFAYRPGSRPWPLVRNKALVAAAVACSEAWDVRVLALVAPWSKTHGTEYTASLAESRGLRVERLVCPEELGQLETHDRRLL